MGFGNDEKCSTVDEIDIEAIWKMKLCFVKFHEIWNFIDYCICETTQNTEHRGV